MPEKWIGMLAAFLVHNPASVVAMPAPIPHSAWQQRQPSSVYLLRKPTAFWGAC